MTRRRPRSRGATVDFVIRWERGTINRFIYTIAVLDPTASRPGRAAVLEPQADLLLRRRRGDRPLPGLEQPERVPLRHGLGQGYAIAWSTGTKTNTHYNLVLGGETALMVKSRFVTEYDDPEYTVGLGGSGGGIQQYVYGQNHPGPAGRCDPAVLLSRHGHADHPRR